MSSIEENKRAVRTCFESAAKGAYETFGEILTDDYVLHPEEIRGASGLQEMVEQYRAAVSDLTVTVDQQFAEGDFVATRITLSGTHDGELMGTPATGRPVSFTGITISRCEGGRIAEEWELTDTMGLLAQVGALPEMAHS